MMGFFKPLKMGVIAASFALGLAAPSAALEDAFDDAMSAYDIGNKALSARLFREMAGSGDAHAQFNISVLFALGDGVPQNDALALYWAWRSRLTGLAEAVKLVEFLTPKLTADAFNEIARSLEFKLKQEIDGGNANAMLGLGRVYNEVMPERDLISAFVWLSMAAALDIENAGLLRDAVGLEMNLKDRVDAQGRAARMFAEWCGVQEQAPIACNVVLSSK